MQRQIRQAGRTSWARERTDVEEVRADFTARLRNFLLDSRRQSVFSASDVRRQGHCRGRGSTRSDQPTLRQPNKQPKAVLTIDPPAKEILPLLVLSRRRRPKEVAEDDGEREGVFGLKGADLREEGREVARGRTEGEAGRPPGGTSVS